MRKAAQAGRLYHLWWHPHNFARSTEENFSQLHRLLEFFAKLRGRYGMETLTMGEAARRAAAAAHTVDQFTAAQEPAAED
jgi:hypothetical protein